MKTARFVIAVATLCVTADAAPRAANEASEITNDDALRAKCGGADGGLDLAVRELAAKRLRGEAAPDQTTLDAMLRDHGAPYVWPRAWIASARDEATLEAALGNWVHAGHEHGARRCGVARARAANGEVVLAALVVDAFADLAPFAMHAHVGSWLSVDARMLVPATDARAVVIEPDGSTRRLLSSFDAGRVLARFAPDRAGTFTVQVVADVEGGPRPVLEARVVADVPSSPATDELPGADACKALQSDALFACILQSIRSTNGLHPLARDARLDAIARAHTTAMKKSGDVAHDAGDGDPTARLVAAGLHAHLVGENVAHAESALAAVRSLYASPSHRDVLLGPDFDRVGIAVANDTDGSVWVTIELAASME